MPVHTGLDQWIAADFSHLRGKRFGVVCNQASIAGDCVHILDHLLASGCRPEVVFGPQHGIWGHTQDNMIEWEGYRDTKTGLILHSLYGTHRKPTPEMLEGIDLLVFDVPDVGARYYTFIWTLAHCMEACAELGIPVHVLDRPNPIGGAVEGPVLLPEFKSFVGLYPLPIRHGMTVGEIGAYLQSEFLEHCDYSATKCGGWESRCRFSETGLPWAMPSPNMPTPETALVYPGQCLLEGTQLSEGRGTTRPFEIFGAPYLDGRDLCAKLNSCGLPGVHFRPYFYQPTFHKFVGEFCEGAYLHITNADTFQPVLTTTAILRQILADYGDQFRWLDPPYEYEEVLKPIDILIGNDWYRPALERGESLEWFRDRFEKEVGVWRG